MRRSKQFYSLSLSLSLSPSLHTMGQNGKQIKYPYYPIISVRVQGAWLEKTSRWRDKRLVREG
jgi:hypothetical protein